ncbi:hypothetical protein BDN72DRAFT_787252 [Pluteus cervinus]|uniref:Uncharacterized protein n=1 Tax=Pluteus cervinus TaxID=181527 RepID=A0ACD3BCM4_9AGAR|nr:hypothetical protein BDN72DRAFT_787252 [Pluteus cervinus]
MPGPERTLKDKGSAPQPPRPPNAWILYRSDKLRELPPSTPNQRMVQADVSRLISTMWKSEAEDVRAEYERRADQKKAEHALRYPNYRYQPQTKEQKQQSRIQKKLQKEEEKKQIANTPANTRATTSTAPPPQPQPQYLPCPTLPFPIAAYYQPDVRYGPAGPSPPLSAAPSPQAHSLFPDTFPSPLLLASSSSPATGPSLTDASRVSTPALPTPPQDVHTSHVLPAIGFNQFAPSIPWDYSEHSSTAPHDLLLNPPTPAWPTADSAEDPSNVNATDFVSFNLDSNMVNNMQSWFEQNSSAFDATLQAFLSSTGDPSIFQLSNFDPQSLATNPTGEIEVSLGQVAFPYETDSSGHQLPDFSSFTFVSPTADPNPVPALETPIHSVDPLAHDFTKFFSDTEAPLDYSSYNADDYLNFDNSTISDDSHAPTPVERRVSGGAPLTPAVIPSSSYVPPAGAAYSSTRRVAGSWKPPFHAADSPLDHSPPRPWGVPA